LSPATKKEVGQPPSKGNPTFDKKKKHEEGKRKTLMGRGTTGTA